MTRCSAGDERRDEENRGVKFLTGADMLRIGAKLFLAD
jgi:hypothetical protein